jgi:hypothetical protein
VQVNLVDDVSGTTVGPIFTGQESRGQIKSMLKCKNWRRSAEDGDAWRRRIEEGREQLGL